MMKKILLIASFIGAFASFYGQKQIDREFNSWWTYAGNHKLTDKWGIHTLYSWRRNDFVKNWQQSLLRVGVNYKLASNTTFTLGYDWVETFPYGKQPIAQQTTEQRIFEQFILKNKIGRIAIKHRYKLEHRFIEQNSMKNRFRYRLVLTVPIGKKKMEDKTFFFTVFDEFFVNFGYDVKGRLLNQNWLFSALGYKVNSKLAFKLGYMNQFLIKSDNYHIESNNTLQVGLSYNMDFRK